MIDKDSGTMFQRQNNKTFSYGEESFFYCDHLMNEKRML
jgi:hypothetical protein